MPINTKTFIVSFINNGLSNVTLSEIEKPIRESIKIRHTSPVLLNGDDLHGLKRSYYSQ